MGTRSGLFLAAALALAGYAGLAWAADGPALGWLLGAQLVGWGALALAWRTPDAELARPATLVLVVAAAAGFRVLGLGAMPTWEDDYFRHLWDGWMTWRTGSPYGVTPLAWFGVDGVDATMERVLDGVNHPEHATIYGPVAQAWGALAAGLAEWTGAGGVAGRLAWFKAGLVAAEAGGLWALWRAGGARALLFAAWCPLAVTEIAFAGHVDALVFAAVAGAMAAAGRGRWGGACAWLALACASKAYVLLLAPFFLWHGGWRGAGVFIAVVVAAYAPWVAATHAAGREIAAVWGLGGVGAMAGGFEFNSTGYALLAWVLGDGAGRWAAGGLLVGGLGWIWLRWAGVDARDEVRLDMLGARGLREFVTKLVTKRGAAGGVVPGAAVVGWWALWSPVFHPWYALMALPFLALRPSGWGVGLLVALPLSYVHGLTLGAGATGDFRHPVWVRPAEVLLVAAGAVAAWWRAGRRTRLSKTR